MPIFGQFQGGDSFNVAGNMDAVLKGQQNIHDSMMAAVEKFNNTKQEMEQLRAVSGSILGQYGVDEKGNPDPTAPKYVHDMFKAVNKEGGLANMSKSQMLAGLKAYETGYGLEQQKLAQDAQRENIRGANIANTAKEIELKRLQEAIADENRIKEARKAKQGEIDAISKTKLETSKEFQEVKFGEEKVKIKTADIQPLIERLSSSTDKEEQIKIKREIEKLLYDNSRYSKKTEGTEDYDPYGIGGQVTADSEVVVKGSGKANPLYREFKSAYDEVSAKRYDASGKQISKNDIPSSLSRTQVESYIGGELKRFKDFQNATSEKAALDAEVARYNADTTTKTERSGLPFQTRETTTQVSNDAKLRSLSETANNINAQIAGLTRIAERKPEVHGAGAGGAAVNYTVTPSKEDSMAARSQIIELRKKLTETNTAIEKRQQYLNEQVTKATKTPTYDAGEMTLRAESGFEEQVTQKQIQRSVAEQTDDEYNLMVNYLKASGGVPASFTKEAFYASKGILRPTVMDLGNGQTYVKIGGVEKIVENKNSASQMTIMDQKRLFDAQQMSKQRNMNGLSVNGYNFSGELRVGDIDQANKVRDGVFKTTRALSSVDQMIAIAENASMFSKLMPTEISGIAQSLTNAAQSANRTEIGGSGSWSNQDQIYMDKIIRDPSSGFNALFTSQTIASLKEYRKRLEMSMHDAGTVYGFAFERGGNTNADGLDSQRQQFRVRYSMYLGQGLDKQEALQKAISDTEADYE